jgi:hypothetical protein
MAGDWLKFEKATPDKPEVFAIAACLDMDPDAVVGKLIRVWSWFDTHTIDGNGRSVTPALLDRISGVSGFVTAMAAVGWITIDNEGVRLPNFDRHTGETAKGRALTAKRVASHKERGNAKGNADSVTPPLPREEKRREEQEQEIKAPVQRAAARFLDFWSAYPVKKGKAAAAKVWKARALDPLADQLIAHVRRMQTEDDDWQRGYIPYGSTYIAGERWHDEPKRRTTGPPQLQAPSKTLGAIQTLEAMKHGLAGNRNPDGVPETALLGFGPDSGD